MPLVQLTGRLICATPEERRVVLSHLPLHMRLTMREPGCLFFDIAQDPFDPLVWTVNEGFAAEPDFVAHQTRSAASAWGQATRRIRRDYALSHPAVEITPETEADRRAIHLLTSTAFGQTAEADLIDALRAEGALALSLTARLGRAYLGQVAFSQLGAPFPAWALAPVSVRKCCRGQGIAAALIREGIARARAAGIAALFVLGDPKYYARFGFSARAARGFDCPWSGPYLQLLPLSGAPLGTGALHYAAAFSALH